MQSRSRRQEALYGDVERVVVSRARLARRVRELARRIARLYAGEELTVVGAMYGSVVFLCDLIRLLPLPVRLCLVGVRSYPGQATRSRGVEFYLPLEASLTGRHVLVVDDILDGGGTLEALLKQVAAAGPASVRSCVLLSKREAATQRGATTQCPATNERSPASRRLPAGKRLSAAGGEASPDFVGFHLGAEFVVGYGLDFDGLYRNLPDVCVLKRHAASGPAAWYDRRLACRGLGQHQGRQARRLSYQLPVPEALPAAGRAAAAPVGGKGAPR